MFTAVLLCQRCLLRTLSEGRGSSFTGTYPSSAFCCYNILLGIWHRHVSSHLLLSSCVGAEGWRAPLCIFCESAPLLICLPTHLPPTHSSVYTSVHPPIHLLVLPPFTYLSVSSLSHPFVCPPTHPVRPLHSPTTHLHPGCQALWVFASRGGSVKVEPKGSRRIGG